MSRPVAAAPADAARPAPAPAPAPVRRRASLRRTLVVLLLATVAAMCLALSLITHVSISSQLHAQLDAQLERAAQRALGPGAGTDAGGGAGQGPDGGSGADGSDGSSGSGGSDGALPSGVSDGGALGAADPNGIPGSGEYELTGSFAADGTLLGASWRDAAGALHEVTDASALEQAAAAARDGRGTVDLSAEGLGDYTFVLTSAPGGGQVIAALPLAPTRSTLARLDLTLLGASALALLATGILGSRIIRRTLRPLEEVAAVAGHVADMPLSRGDVVLAERVDDRIARSGTEAGDVGRALNQMLDNVEGALETRQRTEEGMRRFIADASHELRTPLTAIRGYTEMLRLTEELTDRGEQSVQRLEAQSRRMTSLVEDLLLLARLDEGAAPEPADVDLGELVLDAALDAQVTAPEHRWKLDVPETPVTVRGDERQLTQILVNLLSNARKHTPPGTSVRVGLAEDQDEAVLTIADDGPGIDQATGDVFARFTRADAARSGSEGTTGLGLPIVRALVEAHGGRIDLDSRPGRTVFTVRLPLAR